MSWSPDVFIGELRPWPDTVHVVRGKTDETRNYVPESERDMWRDLVGEMVHPDVCDQLQAENAKLHAELTDLRLGSCPSCGIKVENERLRELCVKALGWLRWAGGITCPPEVPDKFADELRELGIEVDA